MSFVSLAVILILGIILGAILINFLRSVMFLTVLSLVIGIIFYIFLASPSQKMKMDFYANKISQSIYKIDNKELTSLLDRAKTSFSELEKATKEKLDFLKKKD